MLGEPRREGRRVGVAEDRGELAPLPVFLLHLSLLSHTVKKLTEVNIPFYAKLENLQNAFKCIITFHSHSNLGTYAVQNKASEKVRQLHFSKVCTGF